MVAGDSALLRLLRTIAAGDATNTSRMLVASPSLASARLEHGATRQVATDYFLDEIAHYMYAGDTALHIAGAGYRTDLARELVSAGADVAAKNRHGAQPLHYAADGSPSSAYWNPDAQTATIALLIESGADPNATDSRGVAPLHRAVRTRCAAAVSALVDGGADPRRENGNGSSPMMLATQNTGRGSSGTAAAKAQQREIVRLLESHGATL
jgi:ankyrin repeat protein